MKVSEEQLLGIVSMLENDLKQQTFAIVSHVYATGPAFKLEEYLRNKVKTLIFIGHPFSYTNDTRSFLRIYQNGKLISKDKFISWRGLEVSFYLKDLLLTIWWLFKSKQKIYCVIGVDNLNAFAGYLTKALGRANKLIFYTIDYIPHRFENRFLNSIYHYLDKLAVRKSDKVWNLSSAMVNARVKNGLGSGYENKQIVVPVGTDITHPPLTFDRIDRYKIVFMGHLRQGQGLEMLISAMREVIERVPRAHLLIVGGGPMEAKLKSDVKNLGLDHKIEFSGFVKDFSEVQKLLADAAFAVAPYVDDEKTFTRYTDPGKPKDYLANGLPMVITKIVQVALEVEKNKCGFAINYDQNELTDSLVKLLTDDELLALFRENALKMAQEYTWDKIFDKALKETFAT